MRPITECEHTNTPMRHFKLDCSSTFRLSSTIVCSLDQKRNSNCLTNSNTVFNQNAIHAQKSDQLWEGRRKEAECFGRNIQSDRKANKSIFIQFIHNKYFRNCYYNDTRVLCKNFRFHKIKLKMKLQVHLNGEPDIFAWTVNLMILNTLNFTGNSFFLLNFYLKH